jgi:hypothetical protein
MTRTFGIHISAAHKQRHQKKLEVDNIKDFKSSGIQKNVDVVSGELRHAKPSTDGCGEDTGVKPPSFMHLLWGEALTLWRTTA